VSSATADEKEAAPPSPATERRTVSVALRLLTAVLSLLAFSVMDSATTPGWAGDYYGRYGPYRLVTPCTRLSFYYLFFYCSFAIGIGIQIISYGV
jgi:hypothetical protein